jgi:hypothetical protein
VPRLLCVFNRELEGKVMRNTTGEWILWIVALSCALHATEEYLTGWQQWALETLGIAMPTGPFLVANAVLVAAACCFATVGWRRPVLSLVIPAATLVNAVFFHLLPTIVQRRVSPGVYTAAFLYMPFSSWAFVSATRQGVAKRSIAMALVAGTSMMLGVVASAKFLSG